MGLGVGSTDPVEIFKHNFENACRKMQASVVVGKDVRLSVGEAKAVLSALRAMAEKEQGK